MTTTAEAIAASLQRPESDLDGASSSYVPSLASPTTRDSLDEGYDPDETLQVIVYDNEEIKIKSSGIYHDLDDSDDQVDQDDQDVVYVPGSTPDLSLYRSEEVLRESKDDDEDVIYISSTAGSRTDDQGDDQGDDQDQPMDHPDPRVIINEDIIQLHSSYEDSQDVEIYTIVPRDPTFENIEEVDAFDQLENGDIVEIEPGKFCMVKDEELNGNKIELMKIQSPNVDYGDLDRSATLDANVKVCTDILKNISFDEISLSSLKKLRAQNHKLRRMSNITSLDSDTKVFNEIWNAVKQDKYDSHPNSLDSDTKVFNALNKSLSSDSSKLNVFKPKHETIHEIQDQSSVESWTIPENPGTSPVYYPAAEEVHGLLQTSEEQEKLAAMANAAEPLDSMKVALDSSENNITALREHCSSRIEPCACEVNIYYYYILLFQGIDHSNLLCLNIMLNAFCKNLNILLYVVLKKRFIQGQRQKFRSYHTYLNIFCSFILL